MGPVCSTPSHGSSETGVRSYASPATTSTTVYDASGPAPAPTLSRRCTHASYHGRSRFFTRSLVTASGHLSDVDRTPTRSAILARPFPGPPGGICDTSRRTSRTAVSPGTSSTPGEASDDTSPSRRRCSCGRVARRRARRAARARPATLFTLLLFGAADDAVPSSDRFVAPPRTAPPPRRIAPTVIRPTFYILDGCQWESELMAAVRPGRLAVRFSASPFV